MEAGLLGTVAVRVGGELVTLASARERTVLSVLALRAGSPVSVAELVDALWGDDPPPSARKSLQMFVSGLRRALPAGVIATAPDGYELLIDPDAIDANRFQRLVAAARSKLASDPDEARRLLGEALALWRGPALAELPDWEPAVSEAARLNEMRRTAQEDLADGCLAVGGHAELVGDLEASVAAEPLRERRWAQLIVALYRSGRQADALRAYQRLRATLAEELGIEPSTPLRDLEHAVLTQDPSLDAPAARPGPARLPAGVVTFLLTDVVGSTRLWQAAPAAMGEALAHHDGILRVAVESHEGVVIKARGEGDSTFNVFARPTDAAAAALAAQAALGAATWPQGCAIVVRIAIHTGEVTERDGDYVGTTVNRAARLRAIAEGGETLVSGSSAELIAERLPPGGRLVEVGSRQLKDLDRPEAVWLLTTSDTDDERGAGTDGPVPFPSRLAVTPPVRFVGRASERELLGRCLKEGAAGQRRLVVVGGEPGIGKSSLSAMFAAEAYGTGATVLYGACVADGTPYQPFLDALGHYVEHIPRSRLARHRPEHLAELARFLPALRSRAHVLPASVASDPDTERYLFMNAVTGLLAEAAADRVVVLVLDDLHWAGAHTLALLSHLVARTTDTALLVLATYRDSDVAASDPLVDALASLRREPGVERIALAGFDDADMVALVETAAGHILDGAGVELAHHVGRETGGNPFFATETLRHLVESGAVATDADGQWQIFADLADVGLPDSIREVIGRRVARLGEPTTRVLTAAAVIGTEFDLDLLTLVTERAPDELLDLLEPATRARLIVETPIPGRFTFAHALITHTLYDDLGPTRRQRLHRQVGEALETICDERPGRRLGDLARHWAAATRPADPVRAITYAGMAGDAALAALAPAEAARWYAQALDLLDHDTNPALGIDLLIGLGTAQRQTGDRAHRETLLDAAHRAEALGDGDRLVAAALANSRMYHSATGRVDDEKVAVLRTALARTPREDSPQRARLLATLCAEQTFASSFDELRELAAQAKAVADRSGDAVTSVYVTVLVDAPLFVPQLHDERLRDTSEALDLALELGDPVLAAAAAGCRSGLAFRAGMLEDIDRCLDIIASVPEGAMPPPLTWITAGARVGRSLVTGDTAEAERLATLALEIGINVGDPDTMLAYGGHLLEIRWQQGRLDEMLPLVVQLDADNPGVRGLRAALATVYAETGHTDEALTLLEEAARDCFTLPTDFGWLMGNVFYAAASYLTRSTGSAAVLIERLEPFHHLMSSGKNTCEGPVALHLGGLAGILGRYDEAERYFAEAADMSRRCRARYFGARTNLEWATMLHSRPEPADPERVRQLAQQALATATESGYGAIQTRARALLSHLG